MNTKRVRLIPFSEEDREQFILDNQWAFKYGALLEFGKRDDHLNCDGEIISRKTIEQCIDATDNETYRIVVDGKNVGGVILKIDHMTGHNHLEILFTSPMMHSQGIGYEAWQAVEALHPETVVWETYTPYFEKRNIHFYVNKCGFHIVEFFTAHHADSQMLMDGNDSEGPDEAFRFVKVMK